MTTFTHTGYRAEDGTEFIGVDAEKRCRFYEASKFTDAVLRLRTCCNFVNLVSGSSQVSDFIDRMVFSYDDPGDRSIYIIEFLPDRNIDVSAIYNYVLYDRGHYAAVVVKELLEKRIRSFENEGERPRGVYMVRHIEHRRRDTIQDYVLVEGCGDRYNRLIKRLPPTFEDVLYHTPDPNGGGSKDEDE